MGERIELNPGENFLVADRTILVSEMESVLANASRMGSSENHVLYFFTFQGRINNSDELAEVTVAMDPMDAFELTNDILSGLELLSAQQKEANDG